MRIRIEYPNEAATEPRDGDIRRITIQRRDDDPSEELGVTVAKQVTDAGDVVYVVAFIAPDGLANR